MALDAYTPRTSSRQLETPRGYRMFTTIRDVPTEMQLPVMGDLLSVSKFVGGFDNHYVLDASDQPTATGKKITVNHGLLPYGPNGGAYQEYESIAYTFPAIYPGGTFMPGGSRQRQRLVPARVVYEYCADPAAAGWLTAPTIWTPAILAPGTAMDGPFEVYSNMLEASGAHDAAGNSVAQYLNAAFVGVDTISDDITISDPGILAYTILASVPSNTHYAGWIASGIELMAQRTIHTWYPLYMRRTAWVRAQ